MKDNSMLYLLLILIIIASALLVLIILAQNPKGGGLSNIGAGASQFLGARQTADFLEKSTWYFGIGILAVVIFTYFLTVTPTQDGNIPATEGTDYTPTGIGGQNGGGLNLPTDGQNNIMLQPEGEGAQDGIQHQEDDNRIPPADGNE